jgi:hypothetical protein
MMALRLHRRGSPATEKLSERAMPRLEHFQENLEHFREKWNPVFRPKMRQKQKCLSGFCFRSA